MTSRIVGVVLLVGVLLVASSLPAVAQEQTGAIGGTVRDSAGLVLPGAKVEARSVSGAGVSSTVADDKGVYRFPALPPGTYKLHAQVEGFAPPKLDDVILTRGQLLTINLTMAIAAPTERVTVVAQSPLVDVRQSASFATLSGDLLSRVYPGADFTAALQLAPGARAESKAGGTQIDGASGAENRFLIDGMDTTNPQSGLSGKVMFIDFIDEVQVKSSGYNAEYAGATGGVVTALTKSGTNRLRGTAGLYEQNNHFKGPVRPSVGYNTWTDLPEEGRYEYRVPWQYYGLRGDVGGPVKKDQLWFYAGVAYSSNAYHEDVTFVSDPSLTSRRMNQESGFYYFNYNATASLGSSVRLRVTGSNQRNHTRGTLPAMSPQGLIYYGTDPRLRGKDLYGYSVATFDKNADGSINQAAFDRRYVLSGLDSQNDMYSGNLDWVARRNVFVNVAAGYHRTNQQTPPEARGSQLVHVMARSMANSWMVPRGYPTIPLAYQQNLNFADNPSSSGTVRDLWERLNVNVNATWYLSRAGQHVIKAGVRFDRLANDVYAGNTQPRINLYWGTPYLATDGRVISGTYGYYAVNKPGTVGDVHSNNWAFWLQDSWTVHTRLTINAGVRLESEHIPLKGDLVPDCSVAPDNPDCQISIQFGFKDKAAPRIGFAYDVKGDGKWKAYGSFGDFYDQTKMEMARGTFGALHSVYDYWTLDTYDWQAVKCDELMTTGCPGTFIEQFDYGRATNQPDPVLAAHFNRPGMTGIDPNIKPTKAGEFTLGIEHQLGARLTASARYVHKWLVRTIEDVGLNVPGVGERFITGNPGFGYTTVMEPGYPTYVTPKAQRDYDALEFRLWKRFSKGFAGEVNYTYSRLRGNYGGLASSDENGRVSPNVNRYFDAPYMSYDRNNQVVSGPLATDRPHALNIFAGYDFKWGTSVGFAAIVESGLPQTSEFLYKGYPVFLNGRNDLGRTPVYSQVDLQVKQDIRLGGNRRLSLQLIVSNLFDQKAVTGYYSVRNYRDTVWPATDDAFFNGPWDPAKFVADDNAEGAGIRNEFLYRTPNVFQAPRDVRFGAKFSF